MYNTFDEAEKILKAYRSLHPQSTFNVKEIIIPAYEHPIRGLQSEETKFDVFISYNCAGCGVELETSNLDGPYPKCDECFKKAGELAAKGLIHSEQETWWNDDEEFEENA